MARWAVCILVFAQTAWRAWLARRHVERLRDEAAHRRKVCGLFLWLADLPFWDLCLAATQKKLELKKHVVDWGIVAIEGLVRIHGYWTWCSPSRGSLVKQLSRGKDIMCTIRNVTGVHWNDKGREWFEYLQEIGYVWVFLTELWWFWTFHQVCFLANPSFNDYKYFLKYGSTSTLQLTLKVGLIEQWGPYMCDSLS